MRLGIGLALIVWGALIASGAQYAPVAGSTLALGTWSRPIGVLLATIGVLDIWAWWRAHREEKRR
jgi:hypothetical protein